MIIRRLCLFFFVTVSPVVEAKLITMSCENLIGPEGPEVFRYQTGMSGGNKRARKRSMGDWVSWCSDHPDEVLTFGDRSAKCVLPDNQGGYQTILLDFFLSEVTIWNVDGDGKGLRFSCKQLENRPY